GGRVARPPLDGADPCAAGRAAPGPVPLPHPKISRRHARVQVGANVEIEDLGSTNGIRLNGVRIPAGTRAELRTGDSFQIGPYVCVLLEASLDQTVEGPARAAIQLSDPTANAVPEVVARVAQGTVNVLIQGETGVGKEVLAQT